MIQTKHTESQIRDTQDQNLTANPIFFVNGTTISEFGCESIEGLSERELDRELNDRDLDGEVQLRM